MDSPLTPVFYKINKPVLSDDSTIKVSQIRVPSSENQNETNLGPGESLTFTYSGCSSLVSVHSLKSGFHMSFKFKTKGGTDAGTSNTDKHDGDVTLISNFWAHMFSELSVSNGSTQLERIDNFGIVYNANCLIENPDFLTLGSGAGFIPDEKTGDISDPGYKKRKLSYNYALTGADDAAKNVKYRTLDLFVPLRFISGFCNSFNRLTSNFSYTFLLKRAGAANRRVFSGAAHTNMEIKLEKIELFLETIEPKTALKVEYLKAIEHDVDVAYTAYMCRSEPNVARQTICVKESSCSNPRYIIVCFQEASLNAANLLTNNAGKFHNASVRSVQHEISDNMFPAQPQNGSFSQNKVSKFYNELQDLAVKENGGIVITALQFSRLYPLFGSDVSARQMPTDNAPINIVTSVERDNAADMNLFIIYAYERKVKLNMINNSSSKV